LTSVSRKQLVRKVELGKQLHRSGRFEEAERLYLAVLRRDPRNADAMHYLGLLAHETGDRGRARDLLARSLAIRPTAPSHLNNVARVCLAEGNPEGAIYFLRQAIDLRPGYGAAYGVLAAALRARGRASQAVYAARWALDLGYETVEVIGDLVWGLLESRETEEAVGMFHKCLRLEGGTAQVWYEIGASLATRGLHRDALDAYRRAILIRPGHRGANLAIDTSLARLIH
jgi:tetratricopeptide (TPR) repeat protein